MGLLDKEIKYIKKQAQKLGKKAQMIENGKLTPNAKKILLAAGTTSAVGVGLVFAVKFSRSGNTAFKNANKILETIDPVEMKSTIDRISKITKKLDILLPGGDKDTIDVKQAQQIKEVVDAAKTISVAVVCIGKGLTTATKAIDTGFNKTVSAMQNVHEKFGTSVARITDDKISVYMAYMMLIYLVNLLYGVLKN